MRTQGYFYVMPEEESRSGVGFGQLEVDRASDMPFLRRVLQGGWIEGWKEHEYHLEDGGFSDYQPEVRGFRLCSERLRAVLDGARSSSDVLQWLLAWVVSEDGRERRRYWVLHFPEPPDIIDRERSVFGEATVFKSYVDLNKASKHNVMPTPEETRARPDKRRLTRSSSSSLPKLAKTSLVLVMNLT